ncbi:MAG: hypothetical protein AAGU75_12905 [Bacillota bacterium]
MMKKMLAIALAICLVGGTYAVAYADDAQTVNEAQTGNEVTVDEKVIDDTAGILPDSPFYSLELKIEQ